MAVLELVRCVRFHCTLPATVCATRALARWPSGRRRGRYKFAPCGGCQIGSQVAVRLAGEGWRRPPDSQPAEVLVATQRAARDRWAQGYPSFAAILDDSGELDPMREALLALPEDRGEPADVG